MGEGCPNDAELMNYVSSVNIACGYHAGNIETMARTVDLALEKGLAIGAHPSFPDLENFGRTAMTLSGAEVHSILTDQIAALSAICRSAGAKLSHVKPHGALYNQAARDPQLAAAIAEAVADIDSKLILYGLSGSVSISIASKLGLRTASEVFADRTYQADGALTPRSQAHALITRVDEAAAQALSMVRDGCVFTVHGNLIPVTADTICIHGDGPNAVNLAKAVHDSLIRSNIKIQRLHD